MKRFFLFSLCTLSIWAYGETGPSTSDKFEAMLLTIQTTDGHRAYEALIEQCAKCKDKCAQQECRNKIRHTLDGALENLTEYHVKYDKLLETPEQKNSCHRLIYTFHTVMHQALQQLDEIDAEESHTS